MIGWCEEVHVNFSHFSGEVDDLRIYNRAINENEVRQIYSLGKHVKVFRHFSFFDSVFPVENWAVFKNTGTVSALQEITGGYLGAYRKVYYKPNTPENLFIDSFHLNKNAQFNPEIYGAIKHIDCSTYLRNTFTSFNWTFDNAFALRQGGRFFATEPLTVRLGYPFAWHWHTLRNLTADDFVALDGGEGPDFSENGGLIELGYQRQILFPGVTHHLYDATDNWVCIVVPENPMGHNSLGSTIRIPSVHEVTLERGTQKYTSIPLMNSVSGQETVNLQVINPHPGLGISLESSSPMSIGPGETKNILIKVNSGSLPAGVFDGLLLQAAVVGDEILYSTLIIHIVEPGQADLPDLNLRAEDIRLADYTLGESATLSAVIHNKGQTAASDVLVEFYEFGTFLGQTVVEHVPANGSATATLLAPMTTQGERIVRVVIDPFDEIQELDIANNEASQVLRVGESTEPISGHILVTGSLPSTIYTDNLFTLRGKAVYDIFVNGVRYTDYVVKGGTVEITIQDEFGNEWVYGGVNTNKNGNFSKTLQAPSGPGAYTISLAVTDKTFVGKRNLMFAAVERPPQEPSPPLPPIISGSGYSGYWSYSEPTGTWSWTWTARPVNEPTPRSDLRVVSENIYFTNNNPAPGEETTIFAKIQYWAEKSDMIAENVPINFYATYPGTPRLKIAETIIDRLSVGAPDYGGRFVYASMRDWQEGIYLVEVEIDPSYIEENRLNNAATRALIVGQLQSFHGAIAGQVLDAWGGAAGIQLRLYTQDGQLVGNALTGSNGYYHFDNLPVGEYLVDILVPQDYWVDAETKAATVEDQAVSEVGFQLQQEEPAWDAIEDLTARVKDGTVQLVWTHLLGTSLYEIYRGTSSGGPYVKVGETTSDYSTYLDQDVVNGTTYHYIVRRLWGADSSDSNEASATPTTRVRR